MRIHSFLIASLILSAGLVSAQRGMGRGSGQMHGATVPHGSMQQGTTAAGRTQAKTTKGAQTAAATQQTNLATARMQKNPELATRLAPLLPAGMTAEQAAAGYKNWGQFVAALNVSKNLNIPFTDLQARTTGTNSMSLGKAVHELRPDLPESQVQASVRTAEREAKQFDRNAKKK